MPAAAASTRRNLARAERAPRGRAGGDLGVELSTRGAQRVGESRDQRAARVPARTEPGDERDEHELAGEGAEASLKQRGQILTELRVGSERRGEGRALAWIAHGLYVAGPIENDPAVRDAAERGQIDRPRQLDRGMTGASRAPLRRNAARVETQRPRRWTHAGQEIRRCDLRLRR
jgi:hypothetical protein